MKKLELNYIKKALLFLMFSTVFLSCEKGPQFREFSYPEPTVSGFSPGAGRPGYQITITGSNFGEYKGAVNVLFSGVAISPDNIISVTDKQIVVAVPPNTASGKITLKVWTHTRELPGNFTYIPGGEIISTSPSFGIGGTVVTILGKNFGTDVNEVKVVFGSVNGEIVSLTDTKIEVKVPANGTTGILKVFVGLQEINGIYFLVGEEKLSGTIIGTPGSWSNNPATTVAAAFDGNISTFVDGAVASGYLGYDLGTNVKANLKRVRFHPRSGQAARMNGVRVYGTNDPAKMGTTDGDLLYTVPAVPLMDWNETVITNTNAYRYLYMYFPAGNLNVAELEFYGEKR